MKAWLILVFLVACFPAISPIAPERFDPGEAQYVAAQRVTECTGQVVRATQVRWYSAEGFMGSEEDVLGQFIPPDAIYLDLSVLNNPWVSAHELIHFVIEGHDPDHQDGWWESCLTGWRL